MLSSLKKSFLGLMAAIAVMVAVAPVAEAGAMSNYLTNKVVDAIMRGQAMPTISNVYVGLATTTGSPAACGTEVSGGSYARVTVAATLTAWAGTQGTGTTSVSSGTSGQTSNNATITFPAPTANWGTITEMCVFDAASGGNLLWRTALTVSKTVNNGDAAPSFAAAAATWTFN